MMEHILVCDFEPEFINTFKGRAFVIKTSNIHIVKHIQEFVNQHNQLHCVWLELSGKLSDLSISPEWRDVPVSLFIEEMGNFRDIAPMIHTLRGSNFRIFLNTDISDNYLSMQILCSLGIHCGLYFGNKPIQWDAFMDTLYYAAYAKRKIASIEPFQFVIDNYQVDELTQWSSVYFNNPKKYIHIRKDGMIAANASDLINEVFLSQSMQDINNLEQLELYNEACNRWNKHFLENTYCSSCPAWRICLGSFYNKEQQDISCRNVMMELMDAAESIRNTKNESQRPELCRL